MLTTLKLTSDESARNENCCRWQIFDFQDVVSNVYWVWQWSSLILFLCPKGTSSPTSQDSTTSSSLISAKSTHVENTSKHRNEGVVSRPSADKQQNSPNGVATTVPVENPSTAIKPITGEGIYLQGDLGLSVGGRWPLKGYDSVKFSEKLHEIEKMFDFLLNFPSRFMHATECWCFTTRGSKSRWHRRWSALYHAVHSDAILHCRGLAWCLYHPWENTKYIWILYHTK